MEKKTASGIVRFVTSISVGTVIANVIEATTPPGLNALNRAVVWIGKIALTSMMGDKVGDYMVEQIVDPFYPKEEEKPSEEPKT